jgi:heavy metal sensor kinase
MLKSLRSKLLAWYLLVLACVLTAFAAVAVWSIWRLRERDLDLRLNAMASSLARAVSLVPQGGYEINLTEDAFAVFGAGEDAPYYAIWTRDGTLIDRSDLLVDPAFPGTPLVRTRNGHREAVVRGPDEALVLVGQSLAQTRAELQATLLPLAAAGGAALVVASLGGWLLVGRAMAPIGRIAQTAEAMSESNLSLRIDTTRTEDEFNSVATALNQAFDRLQDAFERQARFTADASHELRTPLASQIAEIEWALNRPRSAAEYENALRVCIKAAQRMRAIVEGLLTLARAEAGAIPLRRERVDLRDLTQEVADTFEESAATRGVCLTVVGESASVNGDPDRLRELVSNLVGNAVRYAGHGARVTCSTRVVDQMATVEVADTGVGIHPNDLPHVFDRFYRADKARSREAGGAGLGLSISKWIAESHGARIRCESAVGQGTRFIVEFSCELPSP